MTMPPRLRQLALTAHIVVSVGWLSAVVAFLALAVIGLTSDDVQTVRGAYLVMEPAAWFVLIPLAFVSLLTGLVQALGTTWGLFQHYWVLTKLVLTVLATIVLLLYTQTLSYLAAAAAEPTSSGAGIDDLRSTSPALHAGAALLVLLAAATLSVYKPKGRTRHGQRQQRQRLTAP